MNPQPDRAALYTTCLVDQLLPEVGVAAVKLLRRAGVTVEYPANQTCCGQPFYNSGFQAEAIPLAKRLIEQLEPYPAVVLPGGSCAAMIRAEYPHLLAGSPEWQARARALATKTYELSEFLGQCDGWQPQTAVNRPVTYHDSCHMCRTLGLRDQPRRALTQAGCSLHELPDSGRCCGFGGTFSVLMPEVSNAMTADKLRQASQSGAEVLVTADPGCLLQMRGLAQSSGVQVEHIATVLEEATR